MKDINIEGVGEVKVRRSRRARRVSISVKPPGVVTLVVPWRSRAEQGLLFLDTKREWISKALERCRLRNHVPEITDGYRTMFHTFVVTESGGGKPEFDVGAEIVSVSICKDMDPSERQQYLRGVLDEVFRAEAGEYLPGRLADIAARHGMRYGRVSLRRAVSRWGSCSVRDDISLNIRLIMLPSHLIDYVLLHELCHTVHKNHGPRFHALLDSLCGGYSRRWARELAAFTPRW